MRILLVSDIHSNWSALQTIAEPFDVCLFLGDLVDYGPDPTPCIDWVRQNVSWGVRGNHDHGVAQRIWIQASSGFRYLSGVTRHLSCDLVSTEDRRYLANFPTSQYITLNQKRFLLVHATPRDPLDEYAPAEVEFWARRLEGIDVDYVCCGHTHTPYILKVNNTTIINPGSVGLPRDGDPRAGYAIIEDDQIQLKRIEYDVDQTIRSLESTSLPDLAKQMLQEVYRTGRITTNRLPANGKVLVATS